LDTKIGSTKEWEEPQSRRVGTESTMFGMEGYNMRDKTWEERADVFS
jgi:hypothetical protein